MTPEEYNQTFAKGYEAGVRAYDLQKKVIEELELRIAELVKELNDVKRIRVKKEYQEAIQKLEGDLAEQYCEYDAKLHEMYRREEEMQKQIDAMKNCENCDRIQCWLCVKRDKWSLGGN